MTKWFTFETEAGIFDSRNHELFIKKIERPLMAPIETTVKTIGKRAGGYLEDNALGVLEIKIDIMLLSDTQALHRKDIRELAKGLYFSGEGKLIFSDEPDVHYKAQLTGGNDMESFAKIGETSLSFICGEPFAYKNTEVLIPKGTTSTQADCFNDGSYKAFPWVRIVPTATIQTIRYDNTTTGKHVLLNGPFEAWAVVIVDHAKNLVYMESTGERRMKTLDLTSEFFHLEASKTNIITFTPNDTISARVYYTERFL